MVGSGSWPFQVNLLAVRQAAGRLRHSRRRGDGLGRHHDDGGRAKHPNCAYLGLNTRIQPKVQGDVAAWFGSLPAVPAACKGNTLLTDDGCKTNGYDNFSRIEFWKTPVAKCSAASDLRPLLPLGHRLYRDHRRTLTTKACSPA